VGGVRLRRGARLHLAARHLTRADQHCLVPQPVYHHLKRAPELAAGRSPSAAACCSKGAGSGTWTRSPARRAAVATAVALQSAESGRHDLHARGARAARRLRRAARPRHLFGRDPRDILLDAGKPHVPIASVSREACRRTVTLISPNKAFGFPGAGCAFAIIEERGTAPRVLRRSSTPPCTMPRCSATRRRWPPYRECGEWLEAQLAYPARQPGSGGESASRRSPA
jgi:cystathionine beta-lyase